MAIGRLRTHSTWLREAIGSSGHVSEASDHPLEAGDQVSEAGDRSLEARDHALQPSDRDKKLSGHLVKMGDSCIETTGADTKWGKYLSKNKVVGWAPLSVASVCKTVCETGKGAHPTKHGVVVGQVLRVG